MTIFGFSIMRALSKPSAAKCTLEHYTAFLLAEAQSAGCVRLSAVSSGEFAHDAVNRFLHREELSAKDLFEGVRALIALEGGIPSVDDTVLDEPDSQEGETELVGCSYSGLHGEAVEGINLVTLFYADEKGVRVPVSFRAADQMEGKTKNDLFREMVQEVPGWGLAPAIVTADRWYAGVENLEFLKRPRTEFPDRFGEEPHRQRAARRAHEDRRRRVVQERQGHVPAPFWLGERVSRRR